MFTVTLSNADKRCKGLYFRDQYYNLHLIKEGINKLDNLILNRNDDILYFTFEELITPPNRLVGYINMDTKETKVIDGIKNATSIAIDQRLNKVYVGSQNGLYKINEMKKVERLPIQEHIINLHFKDVLYFTNINGDSFIFEDGFGVIVQELQGVKIKELIVDNDNNMFFVKNNTLFRIKLGTKAINIHEKIYVDVTSTDIHTKAYICSKTGVYVYNKYKFALDRVSDMNFLKGLTFNKANEPIYAAKDLIIKLSENQIPCFED